MTDNSIYKDIARRTDGAIMLGVVGPVRTGKSTFIKRFMETMVIPNIDDIYMRERAKDELPQSGSGRTIMTAEPKFVPEDAVEISLGDGTELSVRLIDCVGYMVRGAAGQFEDGSERMVTTPWFDHEVTMTEAAESGTHKVISEHSTIGIVITCDGSICDIPRGDYIEPEERVINELKSIGKPFAIVLNSADPDSDNAISIASELSEKHGVPCIRANCQTMSESVINGIMDTVLSEFPVSEIAVRLPTWLKALNDESEIKKALYSAMLDAAGDICRMRDLKAVLPELEENDIIDSASILSSDMGSGIINIGIEIPKSLYYRYISEESGFEISDDADLIKILSEMSGIKRDYDRIKTALDDVRTKGYGMVLPGRDELEIDEPQIVKRGGKYAVRLKAYAPAIHMLRTAVVTELSPSIGGENASDEIVSFLLQGYEGDMSRLWESNIFGKSLYDIAEEGIAEKLENLPQNARAKLQETLQKIINEGSGTLICILL